MIDDDASLMRSVRDGDADTFRALVEKYQGEIFNFFLRSAGNVEDAEDLTQQLFVNLYRSARRYRPTASFRTFLYRIATNMAISSARRRSVRKSVSLEKIAENGYEPASGAADADPAAYAERNELRRAYRGALSELPVDWRTAIELRVGRGFSYREIAEIMGRSVSAVESLIFRARERLAKELEAFRNYKGGG
jgi:RNA polymerase sigma-70 factor (ECF subfamily)